MIDVMARVWHQLVGETILPDLVPPSTPVWEWYRGPEQRPLGVVPAAEVPDDRTDEYEDLFPGEPTR